MTEVQFYKNNSILDEKIKFVVIMAEYKDKWVMVRHNKRETWEIPGGHVEKSEEIDDAASRELIEETGAREFELTPVCIYSVSRSGENKSFGQLYYSQIEKIGDLPKSEIAEIKLVDRLPEGLTYPSIQPKLFQKVLEFVSKVSK